MMTDAQMTTLILARQAGGKVTDSTPDAITITMPDGGLIIIRLK